MAALHVRSSGHSAATSCRSVSSWHVVDEPVGDEVTTVWPALNDAVVSVDVVVDDAQRPYQPSTSLNVFCAYTCNALDTSRICHTVKLISTMAGHSIECITHAGAGRAAPSHWALSQRHVTAPHGCLVATFWPCDHDLWPFDRLFIDGRGILMDYLCVEFGDFSFSRFGFIVFGGQTESQRRVNAIRTRLPSWWVMMVMMMIS